MLRDKVAIVTGGTRGIGFAIAARLLKEGAKVGLCGTRQATVDEALHRLQGAGEVRAQIADVSKRNEAGQFIQSVLRHFGRADVLINNAAVAKFRAVGDLDPADWDQMIGLNLSGVYYCCHEILPIFRQQQSGDIINISSLAGKNPFAGGAAYNASKFGLNGFSEAMMLDHRNEGIRVSCIMPGSVATEFGGNPNGGNARTNEWKIAPEDVADIVVSVLSMPSRTMMSRVEVRPSIPPGKTPMGKAPMGKT